MAGRIREADWAAHPLGRPEHWPAPLKFAIDLALSASFPTAIYWGPEQWLLYNDAWSHIPAEKHPAALGMRGGDVWPEIWDVVGPQMAAVLATGQGFAAYDQPLSMLRAGRLQETWWNYSFSPIRDEAGRVLGILNQGNETTRFVLGERARLAQVDRLRELFEQAPAAVALLHGPDHVVEIANPAYRALVGGRDVVGRKLADALPEVVEQGFIALLDRVFESGEAYSASGNPVTLDRGGASPETRILDFVYQPIKDANGNTTDIFVEATDVTARARAEEAARAVAEELSAAHRAQGFLHGLADRLRAIDDAESVMRETATTLAAHLGLDRAGFYRVLGDAMIQFGPSWTSDALPVLTGTMGIEAVGESRAFYLRGEIVVINDIRAERPGTTAAKIAGSGVGVPLTRGGEWVAVFYANTADPRDWTREDIALIEAAGQTAWDAVERVGAASALRDSEEKFRGIANSIDQMIWATRPDGYHDYYNDRWYEYTGVPPGSTDGEAWSGMFHPEDQERAWGLWRHCLDSGEPYHIEYRLRHRSGDYRWVLGRAQAVRDPEGRITRWFGTCTDIQDIVDAREVLSRSREELEKAVVERTRQLSTAEAQLRQAQKMEAVGQLTGGIAHDFNNMLAVVIGALDLLERRIAQGNIDVEKYVTAARDGARRAAALTQRLLAFSRQQPLAPVPVDANLTVTGMYELLVRTIGEEVSVETELADDLRHAMADPGQLENVILNLSVNARDAMPGGGVLTIATSNMHLDEDSASEVGISRGDYVQIAVRDTGVGMSPDVVARAFDPFFTTKGVGKGTGLGLSQVFGFVRQSGGHVRIDSAPGEGTVVRVYLPAHEGLLPQTETKGERRQFPRGRAEEVVMVVEDEDRVRAWSVEALRELGYTVVDAHDGPAALRLIEGGQRIDLLFTDMVMPEMTGLELARRAAERIPGLRTLFTSGYSREETGASDVLAKPFALDQLATRIRAALGG